MLVTADQSYIKKYVIGTEAITVVLFDDVCVVDDVYVVDDVHRRCKQQSLLKTIDQAEIDRYREHKSWRAQVMGFCYFLYTRAKHSNGHGHSYNDDESRRVTPALNKAYSKIRDPDIPMQYRNGWRRPIPVAV